ncbi:hypothetical protein NWE55_16845 (plasmid) [Myroides albus]|uniref:CobQ/CobB/MinD/ParA nucleotide binding domain-containing protein n=1 Tax=Myroides odoratimimus TaxID=76832 RepID=A0AAI8G751_9FLAO|nr:MULTISPECIES: hypothetical protein [Myroides]ALU28491.1 hypothetical protein AS202_20140 [Myroides odoratimimus]UVD81340.1 hypothetical protein NWE55_16845 [Myroides albus]
MIKVIFYNDKSNVGKSFLTMRIGQYLKERFEEKILIIDCTTNRMLSKTRESESSFFPISESSKDLIPIKFHSSYSSYLEEEENYINEGYDIALFDLQNVDDEDVNYIMQSHFIFIVSDFKRVEDKDFKLDRMFFLKLTEAKVSNLFPLKEVKLLINMKDNTYDIKDCDIDILDSKIPYNKKDFGTISTIGKLPQSANKSFKVLVSEIYHIIKEMDTIEVL